MIRKLEDGIWNGLDWLVLRRRSVAASAVTATVGFVAGVVLALTGDRCG